MATPTSFDFVSSAIATDCDKDTLLIKVEQSGAACHDGYYSCFYREWKPAFYPEGLPQDRFLTHYAGVLSACEINATHYRVQSEAAVARWAEEDLRGLPEAYLRAAIGERRALLLLDGLDEIPDAAHRKRSAATGPGPAVAALSRCYAVGAASRSAPTRSPRARTATWAAPTAS